MTELAGARVVLRPLGPSDHPALLRAVTEAQPHLRPWMAWAVPEYTAASATAALAEMADGWADGSSLSWGIQVDGELVGACSLMDKGRAGGREIGYWLHPSAVGRGLATEAVGLVVTWAFTHPIDWLEIITDTANHPSAAVAQRLGFVEVARVTPPQEPVTSAEDGVDIHWRLSRR